MKLNVAINLSKLVGGASEDSETEPDYANLRAALEQIAAFEKSDEKKRTRLKSVAVSIFLYAPPSLSLLVSCHD